MASYASAQDMNDSLQEIWRRYDSMEVRLTNFLSERMLDLANVRPGMRILDLATGRGEPAVPAAHRVGPNGSVLGVDVSPEMLVMARERGIREGVHNLELKVGDAACVHLPPGFFDVTLVRWGLMYMDAPVAALVAARRTMVERGMLVVAVWAEPDQVPFFTLPRRILESYKPVPFFASASSPGTFRYANIDRLRVDIQCAGFRIEHVEEVNVPVMEARTKVELLQWVKAFGMERLLHDLPPVVQQCWEHDFAQAAEAFRRDGCIRLGGVTRIVIAVNAIEKRASLHHSQCTSSLTG